MHPAGSTTHHCAAVPDTTDISTQYEDFNLFDDGNDGNDGGSRYDDADNEEEDGSSSGIGALFLIALGLIFIVKVPAWFNLTGMPALVVRVIGILFILNTLLAFLY